MESIIEVKQNLSISKNRLIQSFLVLAIALLKTTSHKTIKQLLKVFQRIGDLISVKYLHIMVPDLSYQLRVQSA
jgi:hypothetical protein